MDESVAPEVVVFGDHPDCLGTLRAGVEKQGHAVVVDRWSDESPDHPAIGAAAVVIIAVECVDALRLDLVRSLAGDSGMERRVIVVGAGEVADRVRLLNAGADLCLPPGLSDEELLARVLAIIRLAGLHGRRLTLQEGHLTVDLARPAAAYRGRRLTLSSAEYRSLRELALRVMETRSRFSVPGGDDRLTVALRRLSDLAERLERSSQTRMVEQAQPQPEGPGPPPAKP